MTYGFEAAAAELVRVGRSVAERGWVPATSGNFSMRLDNGEIAITVSGAHKGELTAGRIMRVDLNGRPLEDKRPSAETLLHVQLYRRNPAVQAVFHTHSVASTVLSRLTPEELALTELEVMKAFAGIDTHETTLRIPVFPNDQDMPRLAARVATWLDSHDPVPGYLIAGHGLYSWGSSVAETLRHLEAFEFLFQCELETRRVTSR